MAVIERRGDMLWRPLERFETKFSKSKNKEMNLWLWDKPQSWSGIYLKNRVQLKVFQWVLMLLFFNSPLFNLHNRSFTKEFHVICTFCVFTWDIWQNKTWCDSFSCVGLVHLAPHDCAISKISKQTKRKRKWKSEPTSQEAYSETKLSGHNTKLLDRNQI